MTLLDLIIRSMNAGITRERLPDFGVLPKWLLLIVNDVYNEARNQSIVKRKVK